VRLQTVPCRDDTGAMATPYEELSNLFRVMFLAGILMLPLGRAVIPSAVIGGGVFLFALGVVLGWSGLLLRWWSFVSLGKYFTVVVKTNEEQPVVERGPIW